MQSARLLTAVMAAVVCVGGSLAAQSLSHKPVRVDGYTRIVPGQPRPNGFTSVGALHAYHVTSDDYLSNVVIVKTRDYHTVGKNRMVFPAASVQSILAPYRVKNVRMPFPQFSPGMLVRADRYGLGRIYEVSYSADENPLDLCRLLESSPDVEYAEPVFIRHTCGSPDDPQYSTQYVLRKVEAEGAWNISQGDTNVVIAIVDSGVDWGHEDLAANIWTNPDETPDNGIDDDGNGMVDDVHGWDFVGDVSQFEALIGVFREDNDVRIDSSMAPQDGRHHGTHVAGTAGAVTNNGKGIAGMGYNCRLLPVKIGSDAIPGNIFRGYEGILYAAEMGADIINCSWGGGPYSQTEQDVIDQATAMGSLVVAAAGNDASDIDNFNHYPSSYHGVLSVGASDSGDVSAGFSNYGITTTVFAPGVGVLSTISGGNRYASDWSGTSMAAPTVSGIAGLIKAHHPDWMPEQIRHQIRSTVQTMTLADETSRPWYFGRVNARRALEMNDGTGENDIPGIGIADIAINTSNGTISDTDPKTLKLTLRNYLGATKNLKVSVTSLRQDILLSNAEVTIDTLGHLSEQTMDVTVQVEKSDVWFQGSADLLVRYEADGYLDYELVQIPYKFQSANKYTLVLAGLPGNTVAYAGHSPTPGVFWGVGELPGLGGGYVHFDNGAFDYNFISPTALTSVFAFDANRAFTASGPIVFNTTNGGSTWSNAIVSSITPDVRNIHFFSQSEGILIGDRASSKWGIGVTKNGGLSWSRIDAAPVADVAKPIAEGAVCWIGDNGWFGTPDGKVFRTSDRGTTWDGSTVAADVSIRYLAFRSSQQGIAIYRAANDTTAPYLVASTTDGGATWTAAVADLSTVSIVPVHLASPKNVPEYLVMGNDGRVAVSHDDGATWAGVPSYRTYGVISAGTTASDATKVRIWNLGTAIGFLDIPLDVSAAPEAVDLAGGVSIVAAYPNPIHDRVTLDVRLDRPSEVTLDLVDALGRTVRRSFAGRLDGGATSLSFDTEGLSAGTYFCRLTADGRQQVVTLTIAR